MSEPPEDDDHLFVDDELWEIVIQELETELGREPTQDEIHDKMEVRKDDAENARAEHISDMRDAFDPGDVVPY